MGMLAIIGGGNMGFAIARGAAEHRPGGAAQIVIAEPDASRRPLLTALGVRVVARAADAVRMLDAHGRVVLAVKPQVFSAVARELAHTGLLHNRLIVSVMAGLPSATVHEALAPGGGGVGSGVGTGGGGLRVVRVMPNLPVSIEKGMSAVCPGPGATDADLAFVHDLFAALGDVVRIEERLMDAFTAVAGSGPAYVFYLAEAMVKGAMSAGFDAATADRIVRQTIVGAAEFMAADEEDGEGAQVAQRLRARVTSRGGTTAAATAVLDGAGAMETIVKAILAARDRGAALSKAIDEHAHAPQAR